MNRSILFSNHVINAINQLPYEERLTVSCALISELILGKQVDASELSPLQSALYDTLRQNVMNDSMALN